VSSSCDAQRALAASKKDVSACTSFRDPRAYGTIEQLSFPTVGNDSLAVQLGIQDATSDIVITRLGRTSGCANERRAGPSRWSCPPSRTRSFLRRRTT
jgi:hypothetical protein